MNSTSIHKSIRRAALASAVALGMLGASNGFAAAASATGTGEVIAPIAIAKAADLAFGKFTQGATGGTVTVSTSGARTATGDVVLSNAGSTPLAAQFDVTGDGTETYSITWSGDTVLTDSVSTETMALARISDLTAGNATSGEVTSGTLSGGAQSIYLGGTLTVGATQAAGSYTGSVTATVEYN